MVHVIALFIMVQNPSPGPAGCWPAIAVPVARIWCIGGPNWCMDSSMCVIETRNDIDVNKIVIDVIFDFSVI
jgi:hypothetical protein